MRNIQACGIMLSVLAGCSGTETTGANPFPEDPGGTPVQAATVQVVDNSFSPNAVVVAVGGTVTFHWVGTAGHSVTPTGSPAFSPTAAVSFPPKDLTVTFTTAGTYRYYCTNHGASDGYGTRGTMVGTVVVR
jgi:plastocyanin